MPLGAQRDDSVIQMHADVTAHRHNHGLTVERSQAVLEVGHDVGGDLLDARRSADNLLQRGPSTQCGDLRFIVGLVLRQFVHLVVEVVGVGLFQLQCSQAAFVVNRHRRAVIHGLLDVVHMDVIAEHGARIAVIERNRRAGERHEGGTGQRIAQILRIAVAYGRTGR